MPTDNAIHSATDNATDNATAGASRRPGHASVRPRLQMARRAFLAGFMASVAFGPGWADGDGNGGQPPLPTVELTIGEHLLIAELAVSGEQRYRGLGNRVTLAADAAMLFVYERERRLTFTMRDTLLPLSIAFLTDALVIDEIIDMDVGPGQLFPSARPARYALEVNQGWFERHGIEPGARITLTNGVLP